MIRNPIIHKEVLSALRTRKAAAFQGLFLLAAGCIVWLLWPADGLQDMAGHQGRRLLGVLAVTELIMIALFAPAFTATAITTEKERNTLESLFATLLGPGRIAAGKIVGSLTFLVLVVVSGVPALAAPLLLGGVGAGEVVVVLGILLLTAAQVGMIGLLVSAVMRRSYQAILLTYGVLLAVCLLVALPVWPVSGQLIHRGGPAWQATFHVAASLSPLQAMLSAIWPHSAYTAGARNMPPFWKLYIPLGSAVVLLAAWACLLRLRAAMAPPRPRERLKVVERGRISARTFLFLIDPQKRKRMIRWWQNPILIKEFRTRRMLQAHWLLRTILLCLIASILLMFLVGLSVQAFAAESAGIIRIMAPAVAALTVLLILLIGPAAAGGTLCADRESGVWDLIRITRLSSWRIVTGKFLASILPLAGLILATSPALLILLYFDASIYPNVLRILYVAGMAALFVSVAGMFFSSLFSRTATATAWTYGLVMAPGVLALLVLLEGGLFSHRLAAAVFVLNPVVVAMDAAGSQAIPEYGLVGPCLRLMGLSSAAMFAVTVFRVWRLRRPR